MIMSSKYACHETPFLLDRDGIWRCIIWDKDMAETFKDAKRDYKVLDDPTYIKSVASYNGPNDIQTFVRIFNDAVASERKNIERASRRMEYLNAFMAEVCL